MGWTRNFFDQWEWYHKPVSPMEETLLLPEHLNQALSLISHRLGIKFPPPEKTWKVVGGYLYFTDQYWKLLSQPRIFLLPFRFFQQLLSAKNNWLDKILPKYKRKIDELGRIRLSKFNSEELATLLKETVKTEGNLMAESVYTVMFAIFSEVVLKTTYKLLVRDKNPLNYYELLTGYPDKGVESDVELWKIAQIKDNTKRNKQLENWIIKCGYRIQDKDISYPTLGENTKVINILINLYASSPNPAEKVLSARNRREAREIYIKWNTPLFILPLFTRIKNLAQDYARIRNSRPFYYQGNRLIRKILFVIASRIPKLNDPNDIFYLYFRELKLALDGKAHPRLGAKIVDRKENYKEWLSRNPPLVINE